MWYNKTCGVDSKIWCKSVRALSIGQIEPEKGAGNPITKSKFGGIDSSGNYLT